MKKFVLESTIITGNVGWSYQFLKSAQKTMNEYLTVNDLIA